MDNDSSEIIIKIIIVIIIIIQVLLRNKREKYNQKPTLTNRY